MSTDESLRDHLLYLLNGGGAHIHFETAIGGLPVKMRGRRPKGAAHSPWEILEHMRIAQWDILEFSRNPRHVSPEFPKGYWPRTQSPPNSKSWSRALRAFQDDLEALCKMVKDRRSDLFTPFPHGQGQTLLREALLVADHNSYHLGELVAVRRMLTCWKDPGWT